MSDLSLCRLLVRFLVSSAVPMVMCCGLVSGCQGTPQQGSIAAQDSPPLAGVGKVGRRPAKVASSVGPVASVQATGAPAVAYVAPALAGRGDSLSQETLRGLRRFARLTASPMRLRVDEARGAVAVLHGDVAQPYGSGPAAAQAFVQSWLPALGLRGEGARAVTLTGLGNQSEQDGSAVHSFGLAYRGLPVFLAEVHVHMDGRNHVRSLLTAGLSEINALTGSRSIDGAAALQVARAAVGPAPSAFVLPSLPSPQLGVWPGSRGDHAGGTLAYRVYLHALSPSDGYQTYAVYVDAAAAEVLAIHAQRVTETPSASTGMARIHTGSTVPLALSFYESSGYYALIDQSRGLSSGMGVTFMGGYNENPADDTLIVSRDPAQWEPEAALIHRNLTLSLDYFKKTHGRNGWDGQGANMPIVAHFGADYNNAYWSGWERVIAIGDGDRQRYYPLGRGLDVIAHELSHAIVDASGGLVYQNQSGALNESFADVMAIMVDRDDYLLGEDVAGPRYGRPALRSVADPAAFGFPAHMREYDNGGYDYGGVHINSSIPNHAAYLLAEARSRAAVERIWYRTLQQRHLTSTATFRDMALGTLAACEELIGNNRTTAADCDALVQSWAGVGVLSLSELPGGGCPSNSKAKMGLCLCDRGYTPSADGTACIAFANISCPANAVATQGQCYCLDGYAPNSDFSACLEKKDACPLNAEWDAQTMRCVCKEGFEGDPEAAEGECNAVDSNCGDNMHPEWLSDPVQNPTDYDCLCNDGFELSLDGMSCVVPLGGCGNESFFGRCYGSDLLYCGPDGIERVACGASNLTCGLVDSLIGFDCLNPRGRAPGRSCDPMVYQQCGATSPFCVEDADGDGGFCSHECSKDADCEAVFGCCATVSDGTRACLTADYCEVVVDKNARCTDVPGGSTYKGSCEGNVLRFCDGTSKTTREVTCNTDGRVCARVSSSESYDCVAKNQAELDFTPQEFCPFTKDGACDVPERCPEGSDLFDCNPCGEVDADGECDGDSVLRCDAEAGLLTVDCAAMDGMTCRLSEGVASCVMQFDGAPDAGLMDGGSDADVGVPGEVDASMEAEDSVSCSCRVVGVGPERRGAPALWALLALAGLVVRRSRLRARAPGRSQAP